jgi:hypothetical protein
MVSEYTVLVGKFEGKPKPRWDDNVKMVVKGI